MKKAIVKRLVGVSMAAIMTISLGACVNGSVDDDQNPQSKEETTVTITMGRLTTANPKFPDGDNYEDNAYTRYLKEHLNIEIKDEFEATGEDYDRQVSLAIASGELPDMMRVGNREILAELVENDLVEDLTDVYQEYASDFIKKSYDSYDGRTLEAAMFDGRLMAMPGSKVDDAPCEVYIRQDWLDELGLKVDEDGDKCLTLEELENIAQIFIEQDPGKSGNPVGLAFAPFLIGADYGASAHTLTAIASVYQAFPDRWLMDEEGKVYNGLCSEGTKQTLAKLAEWFQSGIVDPQFGTRTWDDITTLLTNEQLGIAFGPWHMPDWLLFNVRAMNPNADFSIFALEDANGKVNVTHDRADNGYMVVRKGFSNPEALIKMYNLYFDEIENDKDLETNAPEIYEYAVKAVDDSSKPVQAGVYASTYLLDDYFDIVKGVNGEITMNEVRAAVSRTLIEQCNRYLSDPENATAADWSKYTSRIYGIGLIENMHEQNKFEWFSPVFFGTTETMKTNNADLIKLREESFVAFVTGAKSIDEFDDFVADWNARGGEQVTKEIQEIVDNQ